MKRTKNKEYYEWQDYRRDILKLARKIKATRRRFRNIYGLPRNGLVLAVSLSHILKFPIIFDERKISAHTLVVDDIVDTGRTIKRLRKKTKKPLPVFALYYNPNAGIEPEAHIRVKTKWVVFPWETKKSSRYDLTI